MRIFKSRWFDRWARDESVSVVELRTAAAEIVAGKIEADLGGGLFKKRLARPGQGKSGSYRVIVGYRRPNSDRLIFLYAFAKSARANIGKREQAALSAAAGPVLRASDEQILMMLADGTVKEVKTDE